MSDSRFAALEAISAVMPAGMRLLAGLARSIAPMVNCVIFDSEPVGVHEVSAIELVQITVSTKMSGSDTKASSQGTPKKACVTHAPSTLNTGTPTNGHPQRQLDVREHIGSAPLCGRGAGTSARR